MSSIRLLGITPRHGSALYMTLDDDENKCNLNSSNKCKNAHKRIKRDVIYSTIRRVPVYPGFFVF